MRIVHLSDIHLNFLGPQARQAFYDVVNHTFCDAIVITGDISEGHLIDEHLDEFNIFLNAPVYYTLGNHDYYSTSYTKLRDLATSYSKDSEIVYLTTNPNPVDLGHGIGLVGVDGWGDGHYGKPYNNRLVMSDWMLIKDLIPFRDDRDSLISKLADFARIDADLARTHLRLALSQFDEVIMATHVPPWPESALYHGKPSDPNFAPWFICKAVGDAILEVAAEHPTKTIHVLSGHVHSPSYYRAAPNVHATTAGAEYSNPQITRIFTLDDRELSCEECAITSKSGFGWVTSPPSIYFCSEECGVKFGYNTRELSEQ